MQLLRYSDHAICTCVLFSWQDDKILQSQSYIVIT